MTAGNSRLQLPIKGNHLFYGDNLTILRESIPDESVDLIYLDPPFNSQATYNVLFRSPTGEQSEAQIEAFEDTWHWNQTAEDAFDQVMTSGNTDAAEMLRAIRGFLKENDMMAYLTMMAVRLLELRRVLKPTGSIYLHCDPTASHYLKLILDSIFGAHRFRNEVIWKRTAAHSAAVRWGDVHDVILFYTKSDIFTWVPGLTAYDEQYKERYKNKGEDGRLWSDDNLTAPGVRNGDSGATWKGFNPTGRGNHWKISNAAIVPIVGEERTKTLSTTDKLDLLDVHGLIHWPKSGGFPRFKRYLGSGIRVQDIITDIPPLNSQAQERLGYPTQKPVALLERIIAASSNSGDVVLDPFCGCGTTIHAAQKLGRTWLGIDITHLAISLIEKRLQDAFPSISYTVHGTPMDMEGAQALSDQDKYQFQWWAVSLVDAVPYGGQKKGADTGIDGLIYFKPDGKTTERAIVSVKGGANVGVDMIKNLIATVDREKAKVGVFITLTRPTRPMLTEAVTAGFYEPPHHAKVPKIQVITVDDLFAGKQPQLPFVDTSVFKRAAKEQADQPKLL